MSTTVSPMDVDHLARIRANVEEFMLDVGRRYSRPSTKLLDVAPQAHSGARPFFPPEVEVETMDIDPGSGATFIADLCSSRDTDAIGIERYDYVVCTEVLEHTLQPFLAVSNIYKMLKHGGMVFVTTPFNFRIHGPLPDCWRFTEHGLRELFKAFEVEQLTPIDTAGRFLMPIGYSLVGTKP